MNVTVIDPDRLTWEQRKHVDRWLVANGARWEAALEPITITSGRRGDVIEYAAVEKRNRKGPRPRLDRNGALITRTRRLWQRVPLGAVA